MGFVVEPRARPIINLFNKLHYIAPVLSYALCSVIFLALRSDEASYPCGLDYVWHACNQAFIYIHVYIVLIDTLVR